MRFSEMNKKELKAARDELQRRMYPLLGTTRVTGLTDTGVSLEGGTFPATFSNNTGELTIWGRGSRYSGGSMTIAELKRAEAEVQQFFHENRFSKEDIRQEKIRICIVANDEFGIFSDNDNFEEMDEAELEKAFDFAYDLLFLK